MILCSIIFESYLDFMSRKNIRKLRRIKFYNVETDNELEFLSNNFNLTSE
jgi:hypothetical protein